MRPTPTFCARARQLKSVIPPRSLKTATSDDSPIPNSWVKHWQRNDREYPPAKQPEPAAGEPTLATDRSLPKGRSQRNDASFLRVVKRRAVPLGKTVTWQDYIDARNELDKIETVACDRSELALSLSPLMDPDLMQARNKYHQTKKPWFDSSDATDFEQKTARNPYAALLASPVRMCSVTGARLPAELLIPLSLRKHPETGKPWQVPVFEKPGRIPTAYYTNAYESLDYVSKLKYREFYKTLSPRWKTQISHPQLKEIVFREDMADFVLKVMRQRVSGAFAKALEHDATSEEAKEEAMVLWLGHGEMPADIKERKAVDLGSLLEDVDKLKHHSKDNVIYVPRNEHTDALFRWITKLDMYLKG